MKTSNSASHLAKIGAKPRQAREKKKGGNIDRFLTSSGVSEGEDRKGKKKRMRNDTSPS